MDSNNIVNFQESTTISNACTKKSGNLLSCDNQAFVGCIPITAVAVPLNLKS